MQAVRGAVGKDFTLMVDVQYVGLSGPMTVQSGAEARPHVGTPCPAFAARALGKRALGREGVRKKRRAAETRWRERARGRTVSSGARRPRV